MLPLLLVASGCSGDSEKPDVPPVVPTEELPSGATLDAPEHAVALGLSIASLGDVDGDGADDLAATDALYGVMLARGSADRVLRFAEVSPPQPDGEDLLWPLVHGGDLDGDGRGELVVSAYAAGSTRGSVTVSSWPDLGTPWFALAGEQELTFLGSSVAVDDLDGDGVDDLVVGTVGYQGNLGSSPSEIDIPPWVGVWHGPLTAEPEMLHPGPEMDLFGPVRGIGDVDGDGTSDVAISTTDDEAQTSSVWIFTGSPAGLVPGRVIEGLPWTGDRVGGCNPVGLGDVDGDGYGDMTVSWGYSLAYTFFLPGSPTGPSGGLTDVYDLSTGTSSAAGDLDGDGFDDLLVAYPNDGAGRVDVWHGGPDALGTSPDRTIVGEVPEGEFGRAVATGDFDGDGLRDLAISAPRELDGRGRIHVFFGG